MTLLSYCSPHRMHSVTRCELLLQMFIPNAVCICLSLCVCHDHEPCKNDRTDLCAVWVIDLRGSKEPCFKLEYILAPSIEYV